MTNMVNRMDILREVNMIGLRHKVDDRFILHSENGLDYDVVIYNVNEFREKPYAVDVYYEGKNVYGDVVFVNEEFLDKMEQVHEPETES